MKDMKRSVRRHFRSVMVRRAARVRPGCDCPQKLADNLQTCSGHCCGNPRKWFGERTAQELRNDPPGRPVTSFLASLPRDVRVAAKRGDFADADEFGAPAFLIRR